MSNTEKLISFCEYSDFDAKTAKELIKNEGLNKINKDKNTTLLHTAVANGNIDMVKLLSENGRRGAIIKNGKQVAVI